MGEQQEPQLQYRASIEAGSNGQKIENTIPAETAYGTVGQVIDYLITNASREQQAAVLNIRSAMQDPQHALRANSVAVRPNNPAQQLFERRTVNRNGIEESVYEMNMQVAGTNVGGLEYELDG